jgi:two-component system, NtrC family, response regulator
MADREKLALDLLKEGLKVEETMPDQKILFVDDDEGGVELSRFNLQEAGLDVAVALDGKQAIEQFSPEDHLVVVTDLRMPGASGMDVLEHVKGQDPEVPVVVITAHGNVETAVEAMKAGAYDFIQKPFSRDVLLLTVQRALERRRLTLENRSLRLQASGVDREIVAVSDALNNLLQTVNKVARSEVSVLITGESGTGKELLARRLHVKSHRAEGPFVPVNCAAIPAELLESELFGHERGAYTGAIRSRAGRFRKANKGTIFLDEVGEIPMPLQSKLLRVLQEKMVDVVGSDKPVPVDVRVVAATNRSLVEHIKEGRFREDLYYRLNVVDLPAPPLRDRPEDVEVLARHFVDQAAPNRDLVIPGDVMAALQGYAWPGNVRELENACERLVILCTGDTLKVADLSPAILSTASTVASVKDEWPELPPEGLSLVDLERRVIERALRLNKGNVSQTASYLRVPRHILAYRIEKYGIRRD